MERFDHYMERCLYGPNGFYSSGKGIAGRRGDFITSPEVGPLFGVLVARWLDRVWDDAGRPDPFVVVDAGTGPGTLLRSLAMTSPRCATAWQLIGVDRAFDVARVDGDVRIQPELPDDLSGTVVIANELLDNLPFRIVRRTASGWTETFVHGGVLVEEPVEASDVVASIAAAMPADASVPLLAGATTWISEVLARQPLRLLAIDYGAHSTAELGARGGWLRTYRTHQRSDDPLREPGEWDITTDIAVDQLPGNPTVTTQADFLVALGLEELVNEGRSVWTARAARPDMEAFRMRSRISEAEALVDPAGLGSWLVLEWSIR